MSVAASRDRLGRAPTVWTRPLQILTAVCAVVCTIGTLLHGFVMTPDVVEHSMRLAGMGAAEAANAATGSFAIVGLAGGVVYVVGNALGVLALRGWTWVFWVAIVVNVTQGMGVVFAVPPEVFQALVDKYGPVGVAPYLITDGVGLILALILIVSFARFRTPWARHRSPQRSTSLR